MAAAEALANQGVPEKHVTDAFVHAMTGLAEESPEKLMPIVESLADLGPKVVPNCVRGLENGGPLRFYAMQVLQRLEADAADAVPALMITLDDADSTLRRESLFTLGAIGPDSAAATEKIAEMLDDSDSDVARAACYALGQIGSAAHAALPALAKHIAAGNAGDDDFMPIACVWASLKINPEDAKLQERAVPYLVKGLADSNRETVRVEAAYMLGEIGAKAKPAVDALKNALRDESPAVRAAATEALAQIH